MPYWGILALGHIFIDLGKLQQPHTNIPKYSTPAFVVRGYSFLILIVIILIFFMTDVGSIAGSVAFLLTDFFYWFIYNVK